MIELRLAKYKEGKFSKFIDIGEDFVYGGDFLALKEEERLPYIDIYCPDTTKECHTMMLLDGRFKSRTFGDGTYVLIVDNQDNVYKKGVRKSKKSLLGNLHENPELYERE